MAGNGVFLEEVNSSGPDSMGDVRIELCPDYENRREIDLM